MPVRRTVLIPFLALLAALTLVAGACGSDDSSDGASKKTTTTEKAKEKAKDDDASGDSTSTTEAAKTDEEFSAAVSDARQQIKDADGDPCKVIEVFQSLGSNIGNPTTTEQRKQTTELAVEFYTALADNAPSDLSAEADQVRSTVKEIEKEGKAANWSEEFMTEPNAVKDNDKFTPAITKLLTSLSSGCTTTTTP